MKYIPFFLLLLSPLFSNARITRIWLTHKSSDPSRIVVNWQSRTPGSSEVIFYAEGGRDSKIVQNTSTTLHHVEIPLKQKDTRYYYKVKTGNDTSATMSFKGYPSRKNELRIAMVGNWGFADNPDFTNIISDDPHLLISLGDNIPDLHQFCGEGVQDCVEPFLRLIDSQPRLFQSIPFMPILGNHDKEVRPRGTKYPPVAVYDTNAVAYRQFFELPEQEWRWQFSIPDFKTTFIALDLNHVSDIGTTWQTSHAYGAASDQFQWYKTRMDKNQKGHVITLQNEQNQRMRTIENGIWQQQFEKGTMVFSGFGYFLERAENNKFPYFNLSLKAGDVYPDAFSKKLTPLGGYALLRFDKHLDLKVETKSLSGTLLDTYIQAIQKSRSR